MGNISDKTKYKNKRGSVLVVAVFLLMFFVIIGAVILRAGELSATESIRFYRSEQAYFSAKSTVDLVISELKGKHIVSSTDATYLNSPFAVLYQSVQGLNSGSSVTSQTAKVAQADVDVTMKCTKRNETSSGTEQTILITANAKFDGEVRAISREIDLKATSGKPDAGIIGTQYGANDADYDIAGSSTGSKTLIKGGMSVDNANIFRMSNIKIEGDLYVKAQQAINLENIEVTGNLYLYSENFNINLVGCKIAPKAGDTVKKTAVVTSSLNSSMPSEIHFNNFSIKNCDLYIRAGRMIDGKINSSSGDKIYAFSGEYNNLTAAGMIVGDEAYNAHEEKHLAGIKIPLTIDDLVMPAILPENIIDITNAANYFDTKEIDVSGGITVDYEIRGALPWLKANIIVKGDGTVNFWVNTSGQFDSGLKIQRLESSKAAVNFIKEKGAITDPFVFTIPPGMSLKANVVSPFHKVIMIGGQVLGNTIASSYQNTMSGEHNEMIDNSVPWAGFGSLNIMPPTVEGIEGLYKNP